MYQIKYKIKTEAPILISSSSGDENMVSVLDYIPGTILSGIFAWKYIENKNLGSNAHEDDFFYRCFLNSDLCFSNAYILKQSEHGIEYFYPAPFSIQHEKNKETEAYDLCVNEEIESQTKTIDGYCIISGEQLTKIKPEKSLNFHHNRNREKLKDRRERLIFNYESLDGDQEFSGRIIGNKADLERLINNFNNIIKINIGRSKNIQYGQAVVEFISTKPEEFSSEIEQLNQEIDNEFILTLLSHAIILNKNGFSTTSVSDLAKYIAENIEIAKDDIEICKSFIRTNTVENFVSIWLLKKTSETAFSAGSCFKIRIKNWNETIKSKLLELQIKGIGERKNEGFGRFVLNWQNAENEKYNIYNYKKAEPGKPDGAPPLLVKNIIKKIVGHHYRKQTQELALSDCREFCKNKDRIPTNSVLGRLEMIIKNNKPEEFKSIIQKDLRKTAKDKLRRCWSDKSDLFDFIIENNPDIDHKNIDQIQDLKEYSSLIGYNPADIRNDLYKLYWITFFRLMRKENRRSG